MILIWACIMDSNKTCGLVKILCNAVRFVSSGQGSLRMISRRGRLTGRIKSFKIVLPLTGSFLRLPLLLTLSHYFVVDLWSIRVLDSRSHIVRHYEALAIQEDETRCSKTQSVRLHDSEMVYRANYAEVPYRRCNWDEGAI